MSVSLRMVVCDRFVAERENVVEKFYTQIVVHNDTYLNAALREKYADDEEEFSKLKRIYKTLNFEELKGTLEVSHEDRKKNVRKDPYGEPIKFLQLSEFKKISPELLEENSIGKAAVIFLQNLPEGWVAILYWE